MHAHFHLCHEFHESFRRKPEKTRQRGCISMNAIYRIRSKAVRNLQYWDFLLNTASQNKYDDSY